MNGKRILLLSLAWLLCSWGAWAQVRTISGRVMDLDGSPLIGASVIIEETRSTGLRGTTTDIDGRFSLELPATANNVTISFTGYLSETISFAGKDYLDIQLFPSLDRLQEVVITALGIKREQKALGYAVETIGSDAIQNASRISPLSALAGQVSGLQVSSSGSGAGGSQKVLIRGANSLTGGNEPLYVVDGIPMDNSGGVSGGLFGGFDYGNAINNINLDDIESISVLKGGAASALYGSRGQNGVIMITTKSGTRKEGIGITYQLGYSREDALLKPDFQNDYSQGSSGVFDRLNPRSWGMKMEGQNVTNFLGQNQVLATNAQDPYGTFFRTATNLDHSIALDKRGNTNGVYFSASWTQNDGIIPTNSFDKKSFNLRYDSKMSDFITFDARANYVHQQAENRPNLAGSPDNPVYLLTSMPRSIGLQQLQNEATTAGFPVVWTSPYTVNADGSVNLAGSPVFAQAPLLQNPYWAVNRNTNQDYRHRLLGFGELNVNLKKWLGLGFDLEAKFRAGMDYYTDYRERLTAHNTYYKAEGRATGSFTSLELMERNYDFLLSGGHQWGDFTARASVGSSVMHRKFQSIGASSESGLINLFGPYVIQNFLTPITNQGISEMEIQSILGLLSMDYKRMFFLDFTFRNDWTSTLAPENWSYFYPSVSGSWLLDETFTLPGYFDLLKLRASYAGVGNGGQLPRYFIYGTTPNQYNGLPYGFIPGIRPEYNLKSEYTESKEVGLQMIMFGNRLNVDLSYYQTGTRDQLFQSPTAPSSGSNSGYINAGFIRNSGIELNTSYKIIETRELGWTVGMNFTHQKSEVQELAEGMNQLTLGGAGGVVVVARKNDPVGILMGSAYERDELGRIVLDSENLPRIKTTPEGAIDFENVIGNAYPSMLWGFNTQVNYKRAFLGLQVDSKLGHDLFSITNMRGAEFGTLAFTVEGRDAWKRALEIAAITGTPPADGYMVKGVKNGVEGEYPVDPQKYWDRMTRIHEAFVYDASYIRLRQISLGYNINPRLFGSVPVREASLSFFVNNLMYLMRKTDNISPESTFSTGNAPGFEMYAYPELRSYGVNLKVSF